jgi:hypothetical protein
MNSFLNFRNWEHEEKRMKNMEEQFKNHEWTGRK